MLHLVNHAHRKLRCRVFYSAAADSRSTADPTPLLSSFQSNDLPHTKRSDFALELKEIDGLVRDTWCFTTSSTCLPKSVQADVKKTVAELYKSNSRRLIIQEFEHEKRIIQDRLANWSNDMLRAEGFVLLDLTASMKGSVFQDRVVRFRLDRDDEPLPFHRFSTGDSVKITKISKHKSGQYKPLNLDNSIDGVVLERRQWYIDVCVDAAVAESTKWSGLFRLDSHVNTVTFTRMMEGLGRITRSLLRPDSSDNVHSAILRPHRTSGWLRDIILMTYPDSILRLSSSAGGLRMALPALIRPSATSDRDTDATRTVIESDRSALVDTSSCVDSEFVSERVDCSPAAQAILTSHPQLLTLNGYRLLKGKRVSKHSGSGMRWKNFSCFSQCILPT
jgi:hypothetical protein